MAPAAFREVAAEAYVHATESEEAVGRAVGFLLPGARVERRVLGGHFGQSLVRLSARSTDRACIEAAVDALRRAGGDEIARTAAKRLSDDLQLHVRVDKQSASLARPTIASGGAGDVVIVRFRLRSPRLTAAQASAIVGETFGEPGRAEEE